MTDEQRQAARTLVSTMSRAEVAALLHEQDIANLHEIERSKIHPLSNFSLPNDYWAALKKHLMDGGGVHDDRELAHSILSALMQDDQKTFWSELPHLFKAHMKMHGHIRALPGNPDALIINGVGDQRPEGIAARKPSDSIGIPAPISDK